MFIKLREVVDMEILLAGKLETTHKPSKPSTDQPQTSQITQKPAKYCSNHSLISQKLHPSFPEDIFYD